MVWLARISVAHRAVVGLVTAAILVLGFWSTGSLRQELLPLTQDPIVTIVTPYAGATPDVVADQVTEPLETALKAVVGVRQVRSSSTAGASVIALDLKESTDRAEAASRAERAVSGVTLPAGVTAKVGTIGSNSIPVVQLAVSSTLSPTAMAAALRDRVQPLLAGLDGVADVVVSSARDPQVTIDVDLAKATAAGVSLPAIETLLKTVGLQVPAGRLSPDTTPLSVLVGSPVTTVAQLQNRYLTGATGRAVRLGDVAAIKSDQAPPVGYTRTNGVDSIGIGVLRDDTANTVDVSREVADALPRITDALGGEGAKAAVTVVFDQAPFIQQSVSDLAIEGLLGLVFAVLVILAFLMSVRATLITAVSIPLSLLIALIVLRTTGLTINILTLAGMTVAIGRVVDDSIVVVENVQRHIARGEPKPAAVLDAVREVAGAITASTITTVAVFVPIGLISGSVGQLFRPFAVTVAAALIGSLLVSLTVMPLLASLLLRPPARRAGHAEPEQGEATALHRYYRPLLTRALDRPVAALMIAVFILVATLGLVPFMRTSFIGESGGDTVTVSQEMPTGTTLPQADAAARRVEDVLTHSAGVASYQVTVGDSGQAARLGGPPPGTAGTTNTFSVSLADDVDTESTADRLRSSLAALGDRAGVGAFTVLVGQSTGSDQVAVDVRADDPDALALATRQVQDAVSRLPQVSNVSSDLAAVQPVVDVKVDAKKAAAAGLTETQVAQAVTIALSGTTVGSVTIGGVPQPILLRAGDVPADTSALQALPLGRDTQLSDVASVTLASTALSVIRTDGSRSAQVTARPEGDDLGALTSALQGELDKIELPPGATATIGGVSADQSEAFAQLGLAVLAAIAVVYIVMAVAFRSLLQPLLLLVSIPFATTGATIALLLTGLPLGVAGIIGMLMLVGIVVTNAIVLVDRVNQFRREGRPLREALEEGADQRLRPIVMTAVATVSALLPMALGFTGGGAFVSRPLALVVIGGLVSSTALTLVILPVVYLLVEGRGAPRPVPAAPPVPVRAERAAGNRSRRAGAHGLLQGLLDRLGRAGPRAAAISPAPFPGASRGPAHAQPAHAQPAHAQPVQPTIAGPTHAHANGSNGVPVPATASAEATVPGLPPTGPPPRWAPVPAGPAVPSLPAVASVVHGVVTDRAGAGVEGATVTVLREFAEVAAAETDSQGRYRIEMPGPGRYLLVGRVGKRPPAALRVDVPVGPMRADIVVDAPAVIAGTVRLASGPMLSARVSLEDAAGHVVATTDATPPDGFRLPQTAEGVYRLVVTPEGGPPVSVRVVVPSTGVVSRDVVLMPSAVRRNGVTSTALTAR